MATQTKANTAGTISTRELRTSILRLEEGDSNLRKLHEFVDSGGRIRWVVDTDIVHLFLNPKAKRRYADIFTAETEPNEQQTLVALAALLSDFLFSSRFTETTQGNGRSIGHLVPKLILEPHVEELNATISGIARHASAQAASARGAASGNLEKRIRTLLDDYVSGKIHKELSKEQFVNKLLLEIERNVALILPDGPLNELVRARSLLRERQAIVYQADDESLDALITEPDFAAKVHLLTDTWLDRIRSFARNLAIGSAGTIEDDDEKRPNEMIRDLRDAEVLAKLELLNEIGTANKTRYVMISGHGLLHGVIQRSGKSRSVHAVRPRDFLGNPRLFELDSMDGKGMPDVEHDARWKRITRALKLIGTDFDLSNPDLQTSIRGLVREWESVQRMALPYLPAQSSAPTVRQIAAEIFVGKSGEALDTWIYVALSEFFVVTAELGLLAYRDVRPSEIKRKPPPLRLAFYPQAENFIGQVINGEFWGEDDKIDMPRVAAQIAAVKAEQRAQDKNQTAKFNYPLLLCLSARFAALDDWHASRVLASHAKAVALVAENSAAFVTGREAALLEAYSRRLEARNKSDLDYSRSALAEFRSKVASERSDWTDPVERQAHDSRLQACRFDPEAEFSLHEFRADADELIIDFTSMMFDCFSEHGNHVATTNRLAGSKRDFVELIGRVDACLFQLDRLEAFQSSYIGSNDKTLAKIRGFLRTQLELCGLQCALFIVAGGDGGFKISASNSWGREELLRRVRGHATVIAKLAALVGMCIWGTTVQQVQAKAELTSLGNGELLSYDKVRKLYLIDFAMRLPVVASSRADRPS